MLFVRLGGELNVLEGEDYQECQAVSNGLPVLKTISLEFFGSSSETPASKS